MCHQGGTIGEAQVSLQTRALEEGAGENQLHSVPEKTPASLLLLEEESSGELLQRRPICRATRDLGEGERQALMVDPSCGPKLGKAAWRRKQLPCLKFLDHHSQDL